MALVAGVRPRRRGAAGGAVADLAAARRWSPAAYLALLVAVLAAAEAPRHHRRADDRRRVRAARRRPARWPSTVPISHWLLVCTTLLALFLALSKRRHELTLLADGAIGHRPILEEYSPYLLDQMIAVVTASTLVAYSVYATSPETAERLGTTRLGLTIPFVLYGIFRYLYLVHQKRGGGSPADLLLTDRPLLACVGAVGAQRRADPLFAPGTLNACHHRIPDHHRSDADRRDTARVAVVRTRPETVIEDYARVMDLAGYRDTLVARPRHAHQAEPVVDEVLSVLLVAAVAGRRRAVARCSRDGYPRSG